MSQPPFRANARLCLLVLGRIEMTVAMVLESVVRVLVPVGIDTRATKEVLRTKRHVGTDMSSQYKFGDESPGSPIAWQWSLFISMLGRPFRE